MKNLSRLKNRLNSATSLCVIAGMALGFWSGLFWTQLGTLFGNYILFLVARRSAGDWVRRVLSHRSKLAALIHNEGITGVILARLPTLELVAGASGGRTLPKGIFGELAPLHRGNGCHLLKKLRFIGLIPIMTSTLATHAKPSKPECSI